MESLHLLEACELDEGDNGPRGAVPTTEDPYKYLQYPKVTWLLSANLANEVSHGKKILSLLSLKQKDLTWLVPVVRA